MNISQFLTLEHSQCDVSGVSKKRILEYLSGFLNEEGSDASADDIYQKLIERERLGSTGIGEGIAIPHCRSASCKKMTGALLKLADKVDFDAIDGEPVDLVFALIVPEEQNQDHLDALAAIANLLQSSETRNRLRNASSDGNLFNLATTQQETSEN